MNGQRVGDFWPCTCVYACMYASESLRSLEATAVCTLEMVATGNTDLGSWQKWNTSEIRSPVKEVKKTHKNRIYSP